MTETGHSEYGTQTAKRLFSAREAGLYLGLSEWTLRDMIADGRIPAVRAGRMKRLRLSQVPAPTPRLQRVDLG